MNEVEVHNRDLLGVTTPSGALGVPAAAATGVQPYQFLKAFIDGDVIHSKDNPITPEQLQPASVDLRLGSVAYRVRASFLPDRRSTVIEKAKAVMDAHEIDLTHGAVLDRGQVYVIPLQESLHLPASVRGLANPKSSTGRLDVLVRLIAENGVDFDRVDEGYAGPLYLEVAPQTFSVVVRPGTSLNQIRFIRGSKGAALTNGLLKRLYESNELVRPPTEKLAAHDSLVPVTIDLNGDGHNPIGYRAKEYTPRIDLGQKYHYDWQDYWEPIYPRKSTLTLIPEAFYILATREEVRVPENLAAEMVAYESRSGEYRVHYAGFFDPGFGCDPSGKGSKAVLEVRSYVPFMLEHSQPVGWLRYEKMAAPPIKLYGSGLGSSYQSQGLALAKQFKPIVLS